MFLGGGLYIVHALPSPPVHCTRVIQSAVSGPKAPVTTGSYPISWDRLQLSTTATFHIEFRAVPRCSLAPLSPQKARAAERTLNTSLFTRCKQIFCSEAGVRQVSSTPVPPPLARPADNTGSHITAPTQCISYCLTKSWPHQGVESTACIRFPWVSQIGVTVAGRHIHDYWTVRVLFSMQAYLSVNREVYLGPRSFIHNVNL